MLLHRLPTHVRVLARRTLHSCTTLPPSPSASRHLALPLAFLSVKGWDTHGLQGWSTWSNIAAQRGYSSLLIEVDPACCSSLPAASNTPEALLASLETELSTLLSSSSSPFPPVLFASESSALLAETYVSSHPLSALFLHRPARAAPPASIENSLADTKAPEMENDFTYEPNFAIGVMDSVDRFDGSRLGQIAREEGEDGWVKRIEGSRDEQGWKEVEDWMEENGI